jgi:hypothetical protein
MVLYATNACELLACQVALASKAKGAIHCWPVCQRPQRAMPYPVLPHTLSLSRCSSNSVHHRSVVCRQVLEATSAIFDKSQEELATIAYENTCRLFFPNGIPE